jgi:uncharacterized membrane-anchored protein
MPIGIPIRHTRGRRTNREEHAMHATDAANRVAKVNLAFWIMKICATTVGETAGDMLSMTLNIGYALSSLLLIGFFIVTLVAQMRSKTFHPFLYWAVILATSTAGTTMSDYMDRTLKLGYPLGASILATVLVIVLVTWHFVMGSIRVDNIRDTKVEAFYWTAILVSNTLGTALGDFLADSSGLGYAKSNLLISSLIAVIVLLYFTTKASRTILFWAAFVLTRPFGATMGDLLTKQPAKGGLGFGTIGSSAVLLAVLAALIVWSMRAERGRLQPAT